VILLGFITQYLPWSHISRVLFMYHMFGGLIFMILALAFVLAYVATHFPRPGRALLATHLGLAVAFFFYFYPLWTGLPISVSATDAGPGSPIWGPKLWLAVCQPYLKGTEEKLWCWN
jgi:dolichyl-phosphate-mannose--protein O-mannosyl transferase